jgi:Complex I intermediate-associated protein 30 (CIA30).
MKNSTKVLLSLLCVALCAFIFACASGGSSSSGGSGGAAASGPSEGFLGKWTYEESADAGDGGSSTITKTEANETIDGVAVKTYKFKGNVTDKAKYGLAQVEIKPDAETLALFKTAKAISFKMLADGRPYVIEAPISTVTDWGFHRFTVRTNPGEVQEHTIQMRMFMQPAWASVVKFNQQRLTMLRIQTVNAAEGGVGPFEFKVWDLKIYQ